MAVALLSPDLLVNQIDWTLDQYHRLIEERILCEDDHVELLNGKIIPKYTDMPGLNNSNLHYYQVSWNVAQYDQMIEASIWDEDERLELLFGKIVHMSPVGRLHAACMSKIARFFIQNYASKYSCRQEAPIILDNQSQPQPDYVLASFREDDYANSHPRSSEIQLLIEVADQTLARDRKEKYLAYATANIPEYWILNAIDRQIERFTEPGNSEYQMSEIIRAGDILNHEVLGQIDTGLLFPKS